MMLNFGYLNYQDQLTRTTSGEQHEVRFLSDIFFLIFLCGIFHRIPPLFNSFG
jgi:hypothetical protein